MKCLGANATLLMHVTKLYIRQKFFLGLVGFEPTPKNLEGFCPDPLDDKPSWLV